MDILDKFIKQAKLNIHSGYYAANKLGVFTGSKISLKQKITQNDFSVIAEIKHASPAGEYSFDFIDAEKTAFCFKQAGADAISVVVEPKIFKGKLENVPAAKKAGLSVLFKDFVLSKQQIKTAKMLGADCILLVLRVARRTGANINEFIDFSHECGLEVLLECYDRKEFASALKSKADILGINNRDLSTLQVDLNRTKKILESVDAEKIKKPVISESGVKSKQDVLFLKSCGVKGVLVGTVLWKTKKQKEKIIELKSVV